MRKFVMFFALALALVSCEEKTREEKKIAKIDIPEVKIERLDREYFAVKTADFPKLKERYKDFFPEGMSNAEWLAKRDQPFLKELQAEVQRVYPDLDTIETNLQELFRHITFYYPKFKVPRVVSLVNDDKLPKAFYTPNMVVIPLSIYLGRNSKYYVNDFPAYECQMYDPTQILPDIVTSFADDKIEKPGATDKTLLAFMVYYGKLYYLMDRLIPEVPDYDKIGYTKLQYQWAQENESVMWSTILQDKLLYNTDPETPRHFINPAPFTRFGLDIDTDSPGRLGRWIGWQIVRSYMENNKDVTLQQLLATDAKTIFEKSKYKPNK
jgi:gliding motility-associated lipoprotein GldB